MSKNGLWLGTRRQRFDQPWKGPGGIRGERWDRSRNSTCSFRGQSERDSGEKEESLTSLGIRE